MTDYAARAAKGAAPLGGLPSDWPGTIQAGDILDAEDGSIEVFRRIETTYKGRPMIAYVVGEYGDYTVEEGDEDEPFLLMDAHVRKYYKKRHKFIPKAGMIVVNNDGEIFIVLGSEVVYELKDGGTTIWLSDINQRGLRELETAVGGKYTEVMRKAVERGK